MKFFILLILINSLSCITYSDIIKYDQELRKNKEDPNTEQLAEIKNK